MGNQRINAEKIAAPFQLLAAVMVFIVLLDGSFLSAAAVLEHPAWLAMALTVAAIVYPLLFLIGVYVLQTRYRPHLMDDKNWRIREDAQQLGEAVTAINLDFTRISPATPPPSLAGKQKSELESRERELEQALRLITVEKAETSDRAIVDASRELAHAALAQGQWLEAAGRLQIYLDANPDDWSEWFAQAAAYANARGGTVTDAAALEACDHALGSMPADVDRTLQSRLRSYRGGVLKRLRRLEEARAELERARELALAGSYEADDINYNTAGVYALEGDRENAVAALKAIEDSSYMDAVRVHQGDYFASLAGYAPFEEMIGAAPAEHLLPVCDVSPDRGRPPDGEGDSAEAGSLSPSGDPEVV